MKAKLLISLMIALCISVISSAQKVISDQKSIGGSKNSSAKAIWFKGLEGCVMVGAIDTSGHHTRIWLVNINPDTGDTIWTRIYDSGLPSGGLTGISVGPTSDKGIVIGGTVTGFSSHSQALIIKTDSNGNLKWSVTIGDVANSTDFINTIASTPPGATEILVTGQEAIGTASSKSYMAALSPFDGTVFWHKLYSMPSGKSFTVNHWTNDIQGYALYGDIYNPTTNAYEAAIAHADYFGGVQSLASYYSPFGNTHTTYGVYGSSGYSVCGTFNTGSLVSGLIANIDLSGLVKWANTYSGSQNIYTWSIDEEKVLREFLLAGMTNSAGHGGLDGLVFSIDSLGNVLHTKVIGGIGNDAFNSLAIFNDRLAAVGYTSSYGPGTSNAWIYSADLTQFRGPLKSDSATIPCDDDSLHFAVNPISLTAASDTLTADTTGLVFNFVTLTQSSGESSIIDICTTTGIGTSPVEENSAIIFPNPSSGGFTIAFSHSLKNCMVEIYNPLGEVVYSDQIVDQNSKEINLNAPPGIYFVRLSQEDQESTYKIVLY